MATPAPLILTTARQVKDALDALGLRAVARPDAHVDLVAQWGNVLHPCGADQSDATVATVSVAALGRWLAARVQPCTCSECGGCGHVTLEGPAWEPCDRGERECGTCHGYGDALEALDLVRCEHCAGRGTWGADEGHYMGLTIRTCVECDGEGSYVAPVDAPDLDDAALDAGDARADAARDAREGA